MATRNTTGRGGNRPRTHPKAPTKRPIAPLRSGIMGRLTRHGVARIFGPLLRTARLDAGMTQEVLAEEADMDRTYPSLLERGMRNPTLFEILKLSVALEQRPGLLVDLTASQLFRKKDR
jgi:DNA-binding XRE family transcriptional regulator